MHGKGFNRAQRVGDQIQRELADVIARSVNDPRVVGVTLSAVDVSRDLGNVKVFVTLPEGTDPAPVVSTLNRASGYLRRRLAERLRMRYMPALRFVHDATLEQATRVSLLIDSVTHAPAPGPGADAGAGEESGGDVASSSDAEDAAARDTPDAGDERDIDPDAGSRR